MKSHPLFSNLKRPLASIDIESTGADVAKDRIVTLAIVVYHTDGLTTTHLHECNPGIPISKEASQVNGLTDEMVKDWPAFKSQAADVHAKLAGCDLLGFNLRNFDVPMLYEELARAGIEWDLHGVHVVDAGNLFKIKEPRTLEAAVKKYAGREHHGAHDATADAVATMDVLLGQVSQYADLAKLDVPGLANFSAGEDTRLDLAGKLTRDADGDPCFMVGSTRGRKVKDDLSFGYWMLGKDFTAQTKSVLRRIINEIEKANAPKAAAKGGAW